MRLSIHGLLLGYCLVSTTALIGVVTHDHLGGQKEARFQEIDAQRINIREPDGRLRMVITSAGRTPGIIFRGKEYPHPSRKSAGLLFFNEEQTENGGLIFDGARRDGHVSSSGHLSFDQFEQDQVITLDQSEDGTRRLAGLGVADRPDQPMDIEALTHVAAMPEGPGKAAAFAKLRAASLGGRQRLFAGKQEGASRVSLKDAEGRERLRLEVTADGRATIAFLDANGKVVRTLVPDGP